MHYNFVADSFHIKKHCSRLSSSEVCFQTEIGTFAVLSPPLGDLGATYDDHLRLIGKRIVDFLLVLTELFSLTNLPPILHRFQVMADYWPNFASENGVSHFNALAGGDSLPISP